MLVTIGCAGACHVGGVAAVGWATCADGRVAWREQPTVLEGIEDPVRRKALIDWVRTSAPNTTLAPAGLLSQE